MKIPAHIAIIMDGNGRWARSRGFPRIVGHREGARNVKRIATACSNLGVQILTLYGFSTENWSRPAREVDLLFKLMKVYTHVGRRLCRENNIRFRLIGRIDELPPFIRDALRGLEKVTESHTGMILQCAINYSGRDEILRAVSSAIEKQLPVTEETFSQLLDTGGQPDPDLVIRTSGEYRISNFLLWQSAYSEYFFSDISWPDFGETYLMSAIENFSDRQRRFGKTGEQVLQS